VAQVSNKYDFKVFRPMYQLLKEVKTILLNAGKPTNAPVNARGACRSLMYWKLDGIIIMKPTVFRNAELQINQVEAMVASMSEVR
jgi:hypothetical protein